MRTTLPCCLAGIAILAGTAPAHATEHMMVVNEILRSANGDASAQMIELQDIGDEPFPAGAYYVDVFDGDATLVGRVEAPGIMGGNGPRYYVLATDAAASALGMTADAPLTQTLPADGQACFIGSADRKIHCVAWGCVTTKITPATPLGASPPDGMSLQRTPSGAELTVASPTPHAANVMGDMNEPCPVQPLPDGDPSDADPSGGCCQGTRGGGSTALAMSLVLALTTLRRRRVV